MLLLAAAVLAASPIVSLAEAHHAIGVGRLDQAQAMIAAAVTAGATGDPVDRLLSELAFARGDDAQAIALTNALLLRHPDDPLLLERAGIAAARSGRTDEAGRVLHRVTMLPQASWRAWNALGAVADARGDWDEADRAYAAASKLAPDRAEIANNRGWSLLLRGRWQEAERLLSDAATRDPGQPRVARNLELARAAMAGALPERLPGEKDEAWAARLNDAGVVAAIRGERARAIAAFARAIEARPNWDTRAAANLAAIESR